MDFIRDLRAKAAMAHIGGALDGATLEDAPLPHMVIDNALPWWLYWSLKRTIPADESFTWRELKDGGRDPSRGDIDFRRTESVPDGMRPWWFLQTGKFAEMLSHRILAKFASVLDEVYYKPNYGPLWQEAKALAHGVQFGRLMSRRAGYLLPPHRDPKKHAVTALIYFQCSPELRPFGTQLFQCDRDFVSPIPSTYRVDRDGVGAELVKVVSHIENRMLLFANTGAHGGHVPKGGKPGEKRLAFQFYMGPIDISALRALTERLPADLKETWAKDGKWRSPEAEVS